MGWKSIVAQAVLVISFLFLQGIIFIRTNIFLIDRLNIMNSNNTFKANLAPTRTHPSKLFLFNGTAWLEHSALEVEKSEVYYNKKILQMLALRPKIILEAETSKIKDINSELFSSLANSLTEKKNNISFGISYTFQREELNFANPYSVFGGSRFHHPAGIPENYSELHPVHYPQLVLVNKNLPIRVDMVQGIISCSKEIQETNKDCITYSKEYLRAAIINNKQFFPTNSWFTAYSIRMAPMLYLPEFMDWPRAVVIRSYVAQAIFRLIGSYVAMSGPNLEISSKHNPKISPEDANKMDSLVLKLKEWIKAVRAYEGQLNRTSVNLNDLVVQVYEQLHSDGHVSKETLDGARRWIYSLEDLEYDPIENLAKEDEQFEEKNQVLSKPLPVVGVVFLFDTFVKQCGLLHAIYQGVYKQILFAVEFKEKNHPIRDSPLPSKIKYFARPKPGKFRIDTYSFLAGFEEIEKSPQDYEDIIIWQHEDMLANLSFINKFAQDKNAYLAGLPMGFEPWADTEVKMVEAAKNFTFSRTARWPWTKGIQPKLKNFVDAEGTGIFEQNNTVCSILNSIIKKQIPDTYLVWAHLFFVQADLFGCRWKHPRIKDFNDKLRKLHEYDVFHEAASSIALRCSFSPEEIDANYLGSKVKLVTWWDKRRNNVPAMREYVKSNSLDLLHPNKPTFGEEHLHFSLEFRGLTSKGL